MDSRYGYEVLIGGMDSRDGFERWIGREDWRVDGRYECRKGLAGQNGGIDRRIGGPPDWRDWGWVSVKA